MRYDFNVLPDYFCNVLEALEVTPSQTLTHINELLKASADK